MYKPLKITTDNLLINKLAHFETKVGNLKSSKALEILKVKLSKVKTDNRKSTA